MLEFLSENWGTILTAAVLVLIIGGIIIKMRKDRKKGKSACGCNCSGCPSAGACCSKKDDN